MPAKLFCKTGKLKGLDYAIGTGKVTIGNDRSNDIVVAAGSISRRHALIEYDESGQRYYLEDLGSLNGTELDGTRLEGREPLAHLNVITLAHHSFIFQDLEMCARRHGGAPPAVAGSPGETMHEPATPVLPTSLAGGGGEAAKPGAGAASATADDKLEGTMLEPAPPVLPTSLGGGGGGAARPDAGAATNDELEGTMLEPAPPVLPTSLGSGTPGSPETPASEKRAFALALEITEPGGETRRFALNQGENVVGRSGDAGIQIANPSLSRRHAVITVDGKGCRVRDEGSSNHTYLENQEVRKEVEVPTDAKLRFGDVEARIVRAD